MRSDTITFDPDPNVPHQRFFVARSQTTACCLQRNHGIEDFIEQNYDPSYTVKCTGTSWGA